MQGWEHFQERAQWNAILWDFPEARNCSRGIRHAQNPWKQKRQLTQPSNQPRKWTKHDKTNDNQTETHASCWKENGRNRKEECKAGNTSRREPGWMPFCEIHPKPEVILGVFDMLRRKQIGWRSLSASMELFQLASLWGCGNQCHALCIPQLAKRSRIPVQLHAKICQDNQSKSIQNYSMVW